MPTSFDEEKPSSKKGTATDSGKDKTFGEQLSALEGVLGYRFSANYFQGIFIAEILETSVYRISRLRSGGVTPSNWELGRLIDLYQLGDHFDYKLFKLPLTEFEAALKEAGIGTYGGSSVSSARQVLLAEAKSCRRSKTPNISTEAQKTKPLSIEILRNRITRLGGIGIAREDEGEKIPDFGISEQVYFKISVPGPGHLYVLSDHVDQEITCLMPSLYAEESKIEGGKVRVPTLSSDYFDVLGPPAYYRLFAIYCSRKVNLPWLSYEHYEDLVPQSIPEIQLPRLLAELKLIRASGGEFMIAAKDYRVVQ